MDFTVSGENKMYSNYHTHSNFCDGKGDPDEHVRAAIKSRINSLGFSSHAPLSYTPPWAMKLENMNDYISRINQLRNVYSGTIDIFFGLELDYINGFSGEISDLVLKYNPQYTIGAVHVLGEPGRDNYLPITGDSFVFQKGLNASFDGDIKFAVCEYYRLLIEMDKAFTPDIIAHVDLIKKVNLDYAVFDDESSWHNELLNDSLEYFSGRDVIIEVNTGALTRKKARSLFPSDFALKRILDLKIPITLNSDSHQPEDIAGLYPETILKLKNAGFKSIMRFNGTHWYDSEL
jgi:histidinol-phosphatase (PHP family)